MLDGLVSWWQLPPQCVGGSGSLLLLQGSEWGLQHTGGLPKNMQSEAINTWMWKIFTLKTVFYSAKVCGKAIHWVTGGHARGKSAGGPLKGMWRCRSFLEEFICNLPQHRRQGLLSSSILLCNSKNNQLGSFWVLLSTEMWLFSQNVIYE